MSGKGTARLARTAAAVWMAAMALLPAPPANARFADISVEEERRLATRTVAGLRKDPAVLGFAANPDLLRIQREIVAGNPGVLWFQDGTRDTFLRPIREIRYKDRRLTAFNCQDGHIFMSNGLLQFANRFVARTYIARTNQPEHIYNNSHLAWIIGHEIAHWKNDQLLHRDDRQEVAFENRADISSLEYLDGTAFYSYGGGLIANSRNEEITEHAPDGKPKRRDARHASNPVRYRNIARYIQEVSKGRVQVKEKGYFLYDGKPFLPMLKHGGYAPRYQIGLQPADAMKEERSMYVAGQIAFAVRHGVWNPRHLHVRTQAEVFGSGGNYIVLLVDNPRTGGIKVIDKLGITWERFEEIRPMAGKELPRDGYSDEEIYCLGLLACAMGAAT